jgi:hypothetical protein
MLGPKKEFHGLEIGPMTHHQIEACRSRMRETLCKRYQNGKYKPEVLKELQALADEVGASTLSVSIDMANGGRRFAREAEEWELVANIQQALQTAAMVDMCRMATQNHEVAAAAAVASPRATRQTMIVALLAAAAAWAAFIVNLVVTQLMAAK